MVKSVFQAGREKAARRKKFLEEAAEGLEKGASRPKSIFQKGREKKKRKKKFTKQVKKEYQKLEIDDIQERIHKLEKNQPSKSGRRPYTIGAPKDKSKAEYYKIAKQIKKRDGHNFPISTFDKKQLKRYVLKYE